MNNQLEVFNKITKSKFRILIILMLIIFIFIGLNLKFSVTPKRIEKRSIIENSNLIFKLTRNESLNGIRYFEGYAFDPVLIEAYENYISGSGTGFKSNYVIVLIDQRSSVYKLYTKPKKNVSNPMYQELNISSSGFYAKILEAELIENKYTIGIIFSEEPETIVKTGIEISSNE